MISFFQSNLVLRVLSAIVLIPLAIYIFFYASSTFLLIGVTTLGALASLEIATMLNIQPRATSVLLGVSVLIPFLVYRDMYEVLMVSLLCSLFLFFIIKLFSPEPVKDVVNSVSYPVFAILYAILPFSFFLILKSYGDIYIAILFLGVWSFDIGAYAVGSLIGKHKMVPKVSPSKSWEGLIGGYTVTLISLVALNMTIGAPFLYTYILVFAIIIATTSFLGDLFESLLKRSCGVKDSGKTIPGHGGILDRLDSILFALPMFTLYLKYF